MIVVDDRLSSSQAHNLAKFTHQEVIDRERLILRYFRQAGNNNRGQNFRSSSPYEVTKSPEVREAVKVSLKGEQAGFMGMGE